MSEDRVLISTHDLPRAGALRDGFREVGYDTDLVTPDEWLGPDESGVLLVLTGGAEDGGGTLTEQARKELHIPVFALAAGEETPAGVARRFDEVFPRSAAVEDVVLLGRTLIERRRLQRITGIVGETDAMHEVLERVVQIAPVDATVLVTGESGTGKELVARGIHALSPRRHESFIAVNLAALSETLLESELFGHEKGAFTGAIDARRGLFELADGGTIFLDEIGEMPLQTQTKLLRVLEQREFRRVGGETTRRVDVRIVAATNQELQHLVAIGEFRRDLYFRFNVLRIELPPLRERRDDIPLLIREFIREASERYDRPFPGLSAEAMEILERYSWPGNVRELRNLVESMVVLAPGRQIKPEDIPEDVRGVTGSSLLPVPVGAAGGWKPVPGRDVRPELEFIFRTLVDLKVDMDDLRRDFEAYRRDAGIILDDGPLVGRLPVRAAPSRAVEIEAYAPGVSDVAAEPEVGELEPARPWEEDVVVFRPGMTMEDLERRAIAAALSSVGGNRRRAAELLGIGERTLYRKISKYGLEA